MALITPQQLPTWLENLNTSQVRVILLFGENYLCRRAASRIEEALVAGGGVVHPIDGDEEDVQQTLARLSSFSLLGGRQIYRVNNSRLLYSKKNSKALWERVLKARATGQDEQTRKALSAFVRAAGLPMQEDVLQAMPAGQWQKNFGFAAPGEDLGWTGPYLHQPESEKEQTAQLADPADQLVELLARGIPPANVLILVAGEVDKRKKLFKYLKDNETIVDCSVAEGSGAKAKDEQLTVLHGLIAGTLAEQGKKLPPNLIPVLLERVGFHPVALVNELRKLMLAAGDEEQIRPEDVDELVGRTRQDAIYELNSAITRARLDEALILLPRLLANGIHPLAILASLRNAVRSALLFRSLIDTVHPPFSPAMNFNTFQQQYLPALKEQELWKKELSGHPYALYNQFKDAYPHPLPCLVRWMQLLQEAEFRLKGSGADDELVFHRLLFSMLAPAPVSSASSRPPVLAKSFASITIQS
ncbi:MAG: DNA polymerase III subunit delta [bacterium]|nr:DNA polymerase III subunit delta [bacterium]